MKITNLNAQALANTAREIISMCGMKKYTVAKIIAHWNLCVEQAGMTGTYDCPACYKRKASIIGDMERIALQLDRVAQGLDPITGRIANEEIEAQRAAGLPVDEEGNDTREWCGNDIETAHAEALAMNAKLDEEFASIEKLVPTEDAKPKFKSTASKYIVGCVMGVASAHAEALKMDEVFNENKRVAHVTRAEFYLHNAVVQRDYFIPKAHAEALEINAHLTAERG